MELKEICLYKQETNVEDSSRTIINSNILRWRLQGAREQTAIIITVRDYY
jgi:hypothetical protein